MRIELLNKGKTFAVVVLFFGASFLSNVGAIRNDNLQSQINNQVNANVSNGDTEYWALLIAVGVYADNPEQNRPLMLEEIDDLYDVLLDSTWWSEDHIKVIKGEEATVLNIIAGLRWLDRMEDSNDISLVFISTHGSPLGYDIPPFDEDDGTDEILASYWNFAYSPLFIWDDELNVLLNRLESQGVCLIVDSCYAGGFNDPPDWNKTYRNIPPYQRKDYTMSSTEWIEGFAEDVRGQGRVVLMASREDEAAYSGGFAPYLVDGLRGFADSNMDDVISAEEAFFYTEPRTSRQHPTMYDGYEGELPLIDLTGRFQRVIDANNDDKTIEGIQIGSQIYNVDSSENSIVCGYVKDAASTDPIENALLYIRGRDNEGEFFENETTTDSDGFYSINVPPCRCFINVYADGYCSGQSGFLEIDENEILWVNFSLYPRPPENSVICGFITEGETGDPIIGANISLFWEGNQNQFYMNETISDHTGFYLMNVAEGEIDLEAEADGYFRQSLEDIAIYEFEIIWMNFSLYPLPPENSVVCGYITDEGTGSPINNTRVTFEWIDVTLGYEYQNETNTDSNGFYSINIAAGELYLDIRKQGYEFYDPYRYDSEENKTLWINVSLKKETIKVDIAKPLQAFYINNKRITPFIRSRIIGAIDIEVYVYESWYWQGEAEKVEFYIDDVLKANKTSEPYTWTWTEKTFGKHIIKVVAYDSEGNIASEEIEVRKLL